MCVTEWVSVSIDFTDVTLVSDDTCGDEKKIVIVWLQKNSNFNWLEYIGLFFV